MRPVSACHVSCTTSRAMRHADVATCCVPGGSLHQCPPFWRPIIGSCAGLEAGEPGAKGKGPALGGMAGLGGMGGMGMAGAGMGGLGGSGGAAAAGLDDDRWACSWVGAAPQLYSCTGVSALPSAVQWQPQCSCVLLLVTRLVNLAVLREFIVLPCCCAVTMMAHLAWSECQQPAASSAAASWPAAWRHHLGCSPPPLCTCESRGRRGAAVSPLRLMWRSLSAHTRSHLSCSAPAFVAVIAVQCLPSAPVQLALDS